METTSSRGQLVAEWLATIFAGLNLYIVVKSEGAQGSKWLVVASAGVLAVLILVVLGPPLYRGTLERLRRRRVRSTLSKLWPHFQQRVEKLGSLLDGTNTRSAAALISSVKAAESDEKIRNTMVTASSATSLLNALIHDVEWLTKEAPKNIEDARRIANHFETIFAGFYTLGLRNMLTSFSGNADQPTYLNFWTDWNAFRTNYLDWADAANTDLKETVFGATQRLRQWHS